MTNQPKPSSLTPCQGGGQFAFMPLTSEFLFSGFFNKKVAAFEKWLPVETIVVFKVSRNAMIVS